jgi:hypothetical protein
MIVIQSRTRPDNFRPVGLRTFIRESFTASIVKMAAINNDEAMKR